MCWLHIHCCKRTSGCDVWRGATRTCTWWCLYHWFQYNGKMRMHLLQCVYSIQTLALLEIGHIPMAIGTLQKWSGHFVHHNMVWNGFCYCINYHSTILHQEISIHCHGVNDVCIKSTTGSCKYGSHFTICQTTNSCRANHPYSLQAFLRGLRIWFPPNSHCTLKSGDCTANHW